MVLGFVLIVTLPVRAEHYRAGGWYKLSMADAAIGAVGWSVRGGEFGIGLLSPPFSFGVSTSLLDGGGNFSRTVLGLVPATLHWMPWARYDGVGVLSPVVDIALTANRWRVASQDIGIWDSAGQYARLRATLDWQAFDPGTRFAVLAGGFYVGYDWGLQGGEPFSFFHAGVEMRYTSTWRMLGVRETPAPAIHVTGSFTDADGNGVLSRDEKGSIELDISNTGDGGAKDVFVSAKLSNDVGGRLSVRKLGGIGNIGSGSSRRVTIPIAVDGEVPRAVVQVAVTCTYKTEWGERREELTSVAINTAPSAGMVKVALSWISPQGLPDWIAATPLEHADYQASYAGGSVVILNLNTGERQSQAVASAAKAQEYVKQHFLGWDKAAPQITLSSSGGTVNTDAVKLKVRFSDDRKLDGMKLYLNGKQQESEQFAERTESERDYTLQLLMGDNSVRLAVTDWVGKSSEKSISFTRIRGGAGTYETGPLPAGEAPPSLAVDAAPLDGNNTVVGGCEEGVRATVTNKGKGVAKWVRVVLEGDEFLTRQWGSERNLEDIKPGESKSTTFSLLMPTELERRQAKLRVVVKEGRGYSPTEVPELTLNLVPAEKTATQVGVVEDVDNDVPRAGISRSDGYALVVGLSKYQSVTAPKYGQKDAETFAKYVSGTFGISQIKTMYDERATIGTICANLTDWLKKKHGFKVIYFAGHGVPDPENPRSGRVCVLPYDGDPELKSTLIPVSDLAELGANPDDTVVVFVDACYSGEGRTVELASRPLVLAEIPETKAITFAAAEGSQPSKEFEKAQHGYFTYYTLLGLKGKADANNDGWVTTTELYNYVKKNVSDATNEVQVPVLRPAREIRLGKVK